MASFEEVLSKLGNRVDLHARLINTFSLLEYIGARKIVKSQVDRKMNLELLNHIAEEVRHAQILKHLALKLSEGQFDTYGDDHLIAGSEGRAYIQIVDRSVEEALPKKDEWANYLMTTLLIEERAMKIYPIYDEYLKKFTVTGKLTSIVRDEDKHLQFVIESLKKNYPEIDFLLNRLREIEEQTFSQFMTAILNGSQAT
jgi:hypothetical protein